MSLGKERWDEIFDELITPWCDGGARNKKLMVKNYTGWEECTKKNPLFLSIGELYSLDYKLVNKTLGQTTETQDPASRDSDDNSK